MNYTIAKLKKILNFRRFLRKVAAVGVSAAALLGGSIGYYAGALPDHYYTEVNAVPQIQTLLPVTVAETGSVAANVQEATLRLFGIFPVKTVSLTPMQRAKVYIGGEPFGIRMLMAGAMVVSMSDISTAQGNCCPAEDAGILVGDVIQAVDGVTIRDNDDLQSQIVAAEGDCLQVTLLRDNKQQTVTVQPVFSRIHGCWQTGMWVRDSTAGIGTVTYYSQTATKSICFAGLGHAICDSDTGEQIPLASGDVVSVQITDIIRGAAGNPGALQGRLTSGGTCGTLLANTERGVFGSMQAVPAEKQSVEIAFKQEVTRGEAVIYTTLSGGSPSAYAIEIEELHSADTGTRNMVIHVTDERLLAATGGIVQGMSGSPIVQNGRLIGAVTHVFVSDPTRGYAIFAENMYSQTIAQQ